MAVVAAPCEVINMSTKYLIHAFSSTQRLVATKKKPGDWLLTKEWRSNAKEEWKVGKGISLPRVADKSVANDLGYLLVNDGLVQGFEIIDERTGESRHEESTHSRHKKSNSRN